MSCRKMQEQISLYLDNALDSSQITVLETHLASCEKCRHQMNLMQTIPVALHADQMLAPKSDFTMLVMQRLVISEHVRNGHLQINSTYQQYLTPTVPNNNKVVELKSTKNKGNTGFFRSPFQYGLQMASLAAVFVVFFVAAAVMGVGSVSDTTANVSAGINSFASAVQDSLQNPLILVSGIITTVLLVVFFWWYLMVRPRRSR